MANQDDSWKRDLDNFFKPQQPPQTETERFIQNAVLPAFQEFSQYLAQKGKEIYLRSEDQKLYRIAVRDKEQWELVYSVLLYGNVPQYAININPNDPPGTNTAPLDIDHPKRTVDDFTKEDILKHLSTTYLNRLRDIYK